MDVDDDALERINGDLRGAIDQQQQYFLGPEDVVYEFARDLVDEALTCAAERAAGRESTDVLHSHFSFCFTAVHEECLAKYGLAPMTPSLEVQGLKYPLTERGTLKLKKSNTGS
jgi:hypothetical protein